MLNRNIKDLIEKIHDNEDFRANLGAKFWELIESDSEPFNFKRISTQYEDNESQRELIDDIFISLCGYSFATLLKTTAEESDN